MDKNNSFTVRLMKKRDINDLVMIENELFIDPWKEEVFLEEFANQELATYIVVEKQKKVVGFAGFWKVLDQADITRVAISLDFQGRGLGRILMEGLLAEAKKRSINSVALEVREHNQQAIALYERLGFVREGLRPNYYKETGENAVLMWLRNMEKN